MHPGVNGVVRTKHSHRRGFRGRSTTFSFRDGPPGGDGTHSPSRLSPTSREVRKGEPLTPCPTDERSFTFLLSYLTRGLYRSLLSVTQLLLSLVPHFNFPRGESEDKQNQIPRIRTLPRTWTLQCRLELQDVPLRDSFIPLLSLL